LHHLLHQKGGETKTVAVLGSKTLFDKEKKEAREK
jgi:hypothetical protein